MPSSQDALPMRMLRQSRRRRCKLQDCLSTSSFPLLRWFLCVSEPIAESKSSNGVLVSAPSSSVMKTLMEGFLTIYELLDDYFIIIALVSCVVVQRHLSGIALSAEQKYLILLDRYFHFSCVGRFICVCIDSWKRRTRTDIIGLADIKLNYYGWYAVDVPEDFDRAPGMWWFYLAQLFYNPVLAFVKASVLLFLLRLGGQKLAARYAIYALFAFNALQAIAIFLVATLQCLPIAANWDSAVAATATCVDVSFHVAISALTIFTDVLVLALPFWIFLGLNMPTAQKVTVIGAFLLGTS